jgi:hypothetical protein
MNFAALDLMEMFCFQSEEDSKWLQREESNLKKRLSLTASFGSENSDSTSETAYAQSQTSAALQVRIGAVHIPTKRPIEPESLSLIVLYSIRTIVLNVLRL